MSKPQPIALDFPPFRLGLDRKTLHRDGSLRTLRPQGYALLRFLAERHGQDVPLDAIAAHLWPDRLVADPADSIQKAMKLVRSALGVADDEIIHKVPVGYRFVANVTVVYERVAAKTDDAVTQPSDRAIDDPDWHPTKPGPSEGNPNPSPSQGGPPWWLDRRKLLVGAGFGAAGLALVWNRGTPPSIDTAFGTVLYMMAMPSVAFLPATASPVTAQTDLQALSDEIATELRRTPKGYDLAIKSPVTANLRELATEVATKSLDTRYALRTSLRDDAGSRQILIQLVEGPTGRQLWASPYRQTQNDAKSQNDLAARIAREIAVQIRTAENLRPLPPNPRAGHFALQGRVLLESERNAAVNQKAKELFDKAVAMDGRHIQSRLGYARTRVAAVANGWAPPADRAKYLQEATTAVARVLDLDKSTAGAMLLRGAIERIHGNYDGAVAAYSHAVQLNPNYLLAHAELGRTKLDLGRPQETIAHVHRALELGPTDPVRSFWYYWAGMAAAQDNDFEGSLSFMEQALAANARYDHPRPWIAIAHAKLKRPDEAAKAIKTHLGNVPAFTVSGWMQLLARGDRRIAERLEPFAAILRDLGVPARS